MENWYSEDSRIGNRNEIEIEIGFQIVNLIPDLITQFDGLESKILHATRGRSDCSSFTLISGNGNTPLRFGSVTHLIVIFPLI